MRLHEVITHLRTLAPESLADNWDKVGLQVGDGDQAVRRGLLCIDLTEPVLDEAIAQGMDLIVAYHPPIFEALTALTTGQVKQRIIYRAARAGIAIYSPHTALDAAEGGVNDWLAGGVGAGAVRPIRPAGRAGAAAFKLVVFVPPEHGDRLREALSGAGAGRIGNYRQCSFSAVGEGTFLGEANSRPTIGKRGRLERVVELRMEMVCPAAKVGEVIAALRRTHPYEEPAFDLQRLEAVPSRGGTVVGQGRIVALNKPVTLTTLANRVKKHLGVKRVAVGSAKPRASFVGTVGLCAGAGGSLLAEAGAIDAFITGEMRHHEVLAAVAGGVSVILAGHTQTERPYLPIYRARLAGATGKAISWRVSRADRAPGWD